MRKGFLIVLVVLLAAAFAVPAMAGTDINGFYKSRAFVTNTVTYYGGAYGTTLSAPFKGPTNAMAFVEQRGRLKLTTGDENVKAVFHFEIDSVWGDVKGNGLSGAGGGLGADATNVETKNVYVWFKLPNTSLDVTVGIQPVSDSYANVFMGGADMAGIFVNGKAGFGTYRFGWSKWAEGVMQKTDDRTLYLAEMKFTPSKDVKAGANLYILQNDSNRAGAAAKNALYLWDNTTETDVLYSAAVAAVPAYIQRIYMPGFDATFGAGPATVNVWAFYQFGKYKDYLGTTSTTPKDVNISGFAMDARADLNLGPGKAFVEALYISGGDNNTAKYKSIVDSGYTNSIFIRTDMQILLLAADVNTGVSGLYATDSAGGGAADKSMGNGGRGLTHFAAGYTQQLGAKTTGKVGIGYLAASKKLCTDPSYMAKGMGTEVNATVNYTMMKGLDVGLVGAYAWLGDFFKKNPATNVNNKPLGAYDLHARIGYVF